MPIYCPHSTLFVVVFIVAARMQVQQAVPLAELYPFGPSAGDRVLHLTDDGDSEQFMSIRTRVFGRQVTLFSYFVNNNGFISFNQRVPFTTFTPAPFPIAGASMVAPFWADVITSSSEPGRVYYQLYCSVSRRTGCTNPGPLTRAVLERVRLDVRNAFCEAEFTPEFVLIGTWFDVMHFGGTTNRTNTFQFVMATDGSKTYAIFLYPDNGIQWTTGTASGTPALAGINPGYDNLFFTIPTSLTDAVINISQTSNMGIPGKWMVRIDQQNTIHPVGSICSEACKSNPCPNGATCIERELGFTCICPIKYHYIDGDNRCEQGQTHI
jgi:receptor-type tyrosine-protein phosphatase Q/CUB/sushi domain-containing protein